MPKVEMKFNAAQRAYLSRLFDDTMRTEKSFAAMGPTIKATLQEAIRLYFAPFKMIDSKLPPIEVDLEEIKDDDGNVTEAFYNVSLILTIPALTEYKEFKLPIKKRVKKSTLDYVK